MTKKRRDDQQSSRPQAAEQPLEQSHIAPERADRFAWDDDAEEGITITRAEPKPTTSD